MKFCKEKLKHVWDELQPLLKLHYDEVAHYKHIELKPDKEKYLALDETNKLFFYTVRNNINELVGYACFLVQPNIHYSDSIQALQDVIFIKKESRGNGREFISWCDEQLKLEGVEAVYHHVKAAHNWSGLLEKQGYELIDLIYGKKL